MRQVNPYGFTKMACERMMDDFGRAHGLRSVRLRYFNAAGADPDGEIGEWHEPETHLIPLVIEAALGRRAAVSVFGTDYPTPDGTAIRDYVHVCDLADAHVRALDYLVAGGETIALNLGTGHGTSVAEVIAAAETATGHPVPQEHCPRRPGDPARLIAHADRARSLLAWRARHSDMSAIIDTALAWNTRSPQLETQVPS